MNGFQIAGRDISAHDSARTTGKKMANSTVGKSMGRWRCLGCAAVTRVYVAAWVLGLVFALTLWAPPERASAACGGGRTAYPPKKPRTFAPPLVAGDSVLLG